ncbi:glucosaminidase domain-containing protein [Parabacteroides sp. ZJ-118]|uniref:glucosaminidase domain-containing protein n=1 Tax=Parabacteroides sp. ZJ-118 TaxID=2709398 RepID=UPI0013EB4A5B|nr:glucosaminidase domain-containing protein [Parabacteroides sp. ZJ-118]
MEISTFLREYAPLAREAGRAFRIHPVVILAQAALESGWGESTLSREYHNFFGITAYGPPNAWWTGRWTELSSRSLRFRVYPDDTCSFMDYCRLLRSAYPRAADMSANPAAFAKEIAYSPYISEVNGDNREAYRKLIVQLCRKISERLSIVNPKGGQMPPLSSTVNKNEIP